MAEVLNLSAGIQNCGIERLSLGSRMVRFTDESAGGFLQEWILDQASLVLREGDPTLEIPKIDFPLPPPPGGLE